MGIEELFNEAMRLPDSARLELAERLFGSIEHLEEAEVEAAWDVEITRRLEEIDQSKVKLIEHDEAMRQMFGHAKA